MTAEWRETRGCSMCEPMSRQCAQTMTPHWQRNKARAFSSVRSARSSKLGAQKGTRVGGSPACRRTTAPDPRAPHTPASSQVPAEKPRVIRFAGLCLSRRKGESP
eukprot:3514342-Rhodomonas_salina.2